MAVRTQMRELRKDTPSRPKLPYISKYIKCGPKVKYDFHKNPYWPKEEKDKWMEARRKLVMDRHIECTIRSTIASMKKLKSKLPRK